MEQSTRLLAVEGVSKGRSKLDHFRLGDPLPAGARLSPLTLESSDSLLSPLGSHLRSNWTSSS